MKILLICASWQESEGIALTLENQKCLQENWIMGFVGNSLIDIVNTGIGAMATMEALTERLSSSRYNLVLNIGICGSFKKDIKRGQIVNIISEEWGDLGAEDHDNFLDIRELGFPVGNQGPLSHPGNMYSKYFEGFRKVKGITVNKAHGNENSIRQISAKYNPEVESMEGIAVFSYCISHGINFQCLRSISNFVEPRNKDSWEIELALKNLSTEVNRILSEIGK